MSPEGSQPARESGLVLPTKAVLYRQKLVIPDKWVDTRELTGLISAIEVQEPDNNSGESTLAIHAIEGCTRRHRTVVAVAQTTSDLEGFARIDCNFRLDGELRRVWGCYLLSEPKRMEVIVANILPMPVDAATEPLNKLIEIAFREGLEEQGRTITFEAGPLQE